MNGGAEPMALGVVFGRPAGFAQTFPSSEEISLPLDCNDFVSFTDQ